MGSEKRNLQLTVVPLRGRGGEALGRVVMTHDVTRLKQAEAALVDRNRELSAANAGLDAYSYTVSHDLRAPLRAIVAFSRQLSTSLPEGSAEPARELAARIGANAERMQRLIDDLLAFAKLGRQAIRWERVALADVVEEALGPLGAFIDEHRIEVVVADLPPCEGDRALLRQVLGNLLGNAVKFTRGCPAPRVEVGSREGPEGTIYFVRDNGKGFDPAYAERLFVAFERLHDEDEVGGSGVGLATVRQIVSRHGGRVWAESEVGKGATFSFTLGSPDARPSGSA